MPGYERSGRGQLEGLFDRRYAAFEAPVIEKALAADAELAEKEALLGLRFRGWARC